MEIKTILDHIDSGHFALPEFQRGYVWSRDQIRGLFDSLYRRHPVGGLLVWATEVNTAAQRGQGPAPAGVVKLLLDGQQRITTLYAVMRGRAPEFFDGNAKKFSGLRFHLEKEIFEFYQPVKMRDDPLWIDVTKLMVEGSDGLPDLMESISGNLDGGKDNFKFLGKVTQIQGIEKIDLHIDEITGSEKTMGVVVDVFNRLNSGGTKLSSGDLALARICAQWPDFRKLMKEKLRDLEDQGYSFSMDWLLRAVNVIVTGEAKFIFLKDIGQDELHQGTQRAFEFIDDALNMIASRLGLDHDKVLKGSFSILVMTRYLNRVSGNLGAKERDKLIFWYALASMYGRYTSSVESRLDQDLEALEGKNGGLDRLIEQLRVWHGDLLVNPDHFKGSSSATRFYAVLYMLSRMGEAKDWGTGLPLKSNMMGKSSKLEVHHIFPKSRLKKQGLGKQERNALANYCFQSKETNQKIGNNLPEKYFLEVEKNHPEALKSQWIPMDENLWKLDSYDAFLAERRELLAEEANRHFEKLLHGDTHLLSRSSPGKSTTTRVPQGGIAGEEEEQELLKINKWVMKQDLNRGILSFDFADPDTGEQIAVFDLAWPDGLQMGLTHPVVLLFNESDEVLKIANSAGYRVFTNAGDFKKYVRQEILDAQVTADV